eukprot:gene20552-21212_t
MRTHFLALLTASAAMLCLSQAASATDTIHITMDRATVERLKSPAATVIVGNPNIADATVQNRSTLILTGKTVGTTNLVVLDAKGELIANAILSVTKIQDGIVTVQRASARYTYACTPHCNAMIEVGDETTFFKDINNQLLTRNAFGQPGGGGAQ